MVSEPSYALAVAELAHLSGWPKKDVVACPSDAAWEAAAYIQKCRRAVEAGNR